MADETVKSTFVVFNESDATIKTDSSDLNYLFRYSIVDTEGKQLSEWSAINIFNQENSSQILDTFEPTYSVSSVESGGAGINVKWTIPPILTGSKVDIFFSWCYDSSISGTYTTPKYTDTITTNSYYIDIPYNQYSIKAKFVKVTVQLATSIKIINNNALIFTSSGKSTLPTLDGGVI
jgi:hypothetical protein